MIYIIIVNILIFFHFDEYIIRAHVWDLNIVPQCNASSIVNRRKHKKQYEGGK